MNSGLTLGHTAHCNLMVILLSVLCDTYLYITLCSQSSRLEQWFPVVDAASVHIHPCNTQNTGFYFSNSSITSFIF